MTDGGETNDRDERGRFAAGNPGGPGGSRRRPSELRRAAEEAITPEHVAAMVRKATSMGLQGNLSAMRLAFERTCGRSAQAPPEAEPIDLSIPRLRTAEDCSIAIQLLIDGICKGEVDRDAAKLLIDAIQTRLKAIELTEFEDRLAQLEQTTEHVGRRR